MALVGGELSPSRLSQFTLGERAPNTHWIGGWVGPRTGLENVEKRKSLLLPVLHLQPLSYPARSQLLYQVLLFIPLINIILEQSAYKNIQSSEGGSNGRLESAAY
jgi:hypothetical protein